jgi:hypothetical protein
VKSTLLQAAALVLVALFALVARRQAASEALLEPGSVPGVAVAFVDPESTEHLRRVECALEGAPLGGSDSYWAHPGRVASPHTPLYEALLVQLCESGPARRSSEARERLLSWTGPVLGLLTALAGCFAAAAFTRSRIWALLAALYCACAPALLTPGLANRLAVEALWWPVILLYIGAFARSLAADEAVGAVLHSLLAGLIGGLALALSPLSVLPFLAATTSAAWLAFTVRSASGVSLHARAGLLHALAAALVARAPLSEGPWLSADGSVLASWASLAALLALLSSTPFVVAVLVDRSRETRLGAKVAVWIAGLLMIVWLATQARGPLQQLLALAPEALRYAREAHGRTLLGGLLAATPLVLALPVALVALRGLWREPQVLLALALAAGALLAFAVHVLSAPLLALAVIIVLPLAAERAGGAAAVRFLASAAVVLLLALGGMLVAGRGAWPGGDALAWLQGLRWMREGTPSPGPWNAPRAEADWGVLALARHGEAIAYHARRPALQSRLSAMADPRRAQAAHELLASKDLAALERYMRLQSARYLLVVDGDGAWLERWRGEPVPTGSLMARLERGEPLGESELMLCHVQANPGKPGAIVSRLYELRLPAGAGNEGPALRAAEPIR